MANLYILGALALICGGFFLFYKFAAAGNAAHKEVIELQKELQRVKREVTSRDEQIARLQATNKDQKDDLVKTRERLRTEMDKAAHLLQHNSDLAELDGKLKVLEHRLSEAEHERDSTREENRSLNKAKNGLELDLQDARAKLQDASE